MSAEGRIVAAGATGVGNHVKVIELQQNGTALVWNPIGNKISDEDSTEFGTSVSLSANGTLLSVGDALIYRPPGCGELHSHNKTGVAQHWCGRWPDHSTETHKDMADVARSNKQASKRKD